MKKKAVKKKRRKKVKRGKIGRPPKPVSEARTAIAPWPFVWQDVGMKKGNGSGICRRHPKASSACRTCLVNGLHEFRHISMRQGIRLSSARVTRLRSKFIGMKGADIKAASVVGALAALVAELTELESTVQDTPIDASAMLHALPPSAPAPSSPK